MLMKCESHAISLGPLECEKRNLLLGRNLSLFGRGFGIAQKEQMPQFVVRKLSLVREKEFHTSLKIVAWRGDADVNGIYFYS
jgi:hypothetical protein